MYYRLSVLNTEVVKHLISLLWTNMEFPVSWIHYEISTIKFYNDIVLSADLLQSEADMDWNDGCQMAKLTIC
jgi:hypothetical protein